MQSHHIPQAVALQRFAFPPPFDESLLWQPEHLTKHLELLPSAQWVAVEDDRVVATCSNTLIREEHFVGRKSWDEKVGGYFLSTFDIQGSTLYGLDISVHPQFQGKGIGRALYEARFDWVRINGARRYGTSCRIPDFAASGLANPTEYVHEVAQGIRTDRTLTPLMKYGMKILDVLPDHMDDEESRNNAVLLEWLP
ncbi:MAG TPA: GNAT family N-acetyltransferase [Fimbriimonas sp.]|nr:GNAT family N-acetyltransferase [Fimbriimonas sp.]